MHSTRFNFCKLTEDNYTNKMLQQLLQLTLDSLKDQVSSVLHECPYTVNIFTFRSSVSWGFVIRLLQEIKIVNVSIDTRNAISIFPTGDYKMLSYVYAGNGDQIMLCQYIGSIISSERETFGWMIWRCSLKTFRSSYRTKCFWNFKIYNELCLLQIFNISFVIKYSWEITKFLISKKHIADAIYF